MALIMEHKVLESIPLDIQSALSKMTEEDQLLFQSKYKDGMKNKITMLLLSIFFPIQLFFLKKHILGFIFISTAGGFFIWWIIEIFLTPGRVKTYNEELAMKILTNMKILNCSV